MLRLRSIAQGVIVPVLSIFLVPACTLCTGGSIPDGILAAEGAPGDAQVKMPAFSVAVWVSGYWSPVDDGFVWVPLDPSEYLPWAYESDLEVNTTAPGWI